MNDYTARLSKGELLVFRAEDDNDARDWAQYEAEFKEQDVVSIYNQDDQKFIDID